MNVRFTLIWCQFLWLFFSVSAFSKSDELSLEMIYKYRLFNPDRLEDLHAMNDGAHFSSLREDKYVVKYSYQTGIAVDTLFSIDWIEHTDLETISGYQFSDDEQVILISTKRDRIYRYSFESNYFAYNLETQKFTPAFSEGKQQLANISPDGRHVAFVYENNLYIKNLETSKLTQVTSDGRKNFIINGLPDWAYEEEFTLKKGYYWSPDSKKIAFYRFDETEVKEFSMIRYNELYPEAVRYKYPKAGEANSKVEICIFSLITGNTISANIGDETDYYIPRITWIPGSKELCITVLNRRQNMVNVLLSDAISGESRLFYHESNEKYISEFTDDFITFINSGQTAVIMSEKDGFMHLYNYSADGELRNQITVGQWEVEDILGFDNDKGIIYYTSTEVSPIERHVYSICLDGTNKEQISTQKGTNTASFSKNYDYHIISWSDANNPPNFKLYNSKRVFIRTILENKYIESLAKKHQFVQKEFFSFENRDGTSIYAYKLLPPNFNPRKKYPLLLYVYGGPESQEVRDWWDTDYAWMQYMAKKGYIVVCADNRGTNGRGEIFKKSTYLELGRLELNDQIDFIEHLSGEQFIDKKRISVFGWSYGGYMSLLCMTKAANIFSNGVAVAPVTNWKFYDSIYTERFMRKPSENYSGYEDNAPINFVNQLKGNLLLVHGTYDDNVHFQNSAELIKKLIEYEKKFNLLIYPDHDHHINGGNARYYLFTELERFLETNN